MDIKPFERESGVIKIDDGVEFFTETALKKKFVGKVINIASDSHKTFYDIAPIDGRENEFPFKDKWRLVRVTRGFIARKLGPIN